jgi:hypothetical protein
MRRLVGTLAALLLLAATLAAAPHGHAATDGRTPCATCVFAGASASGASSILPALPPPTVAVRTPEPPPVDSPGFAPPPLANAPKNGPPRA